MLKASMKYQSLSEFEPSHHIHLRTNNKPRVNGNDYAIWRRLKLLLFNVRFCSRNEYDAIVKDAPSRKNDPTLSVRDDALRDALREELQGVLAWAIQGAIAGTLTWAALNTSISAAQADSVGPHPTN